MKKNLIQLYYPSINEKSAVIRFLKYRLNHTAEEGKIYDIDSDPRTLKLMNLSSRDKTDTCFCTFPALKLLFIAAIGKESYKLNFKSFVLKLGYDYEKISEKEARKIRLEWMIKNICMLEASTFEVVESYFEVVHSLGNFAHIPSSRFNQDKGLAGAGTDCWSTSIINLKKDFIKYHEFCDLYNNFEGYLNENRLTNWWDERDNLVLDSSQSYDEIIEVLKRRTILIVERDNDINKNKLS